MHDPLSKDDAAFRREFERILDEAGTGVADFTRFVFPSADYEGREFKARCVFCNAAFAWGAIFTSATFAEDADFARTTFTGEANFVGATFTRNANFDNAKFGQAADFQTAAFAQDADFSWATFTGDANFSKATFTGDADFFGCAFMDGARFTTAAFTRDARFLGVKFTQFAAFGGAMFAESARFDSAGFMQDAIFYGARFTQDAMFSDATFTRKADFRLAAFGRVASFAGATFFGAAEFRETEFREDEERHPGPVFSLAEFSRPEAIVFYRTYLGQALFHNCDVSKLNFSSVRWRERDKGGKRTVFEEVVALDDGAAAALKPRKGNPDRRDYGLIAELYQQLKKNYDERKDYWTAGDFHYGEMEMKRMHSRGKSGLARWLNRSLGLVAWYKYASQYGESYIRPFVMLLIVLGIFTLLFPWAGLDRNQSGPHSAASAQAPPEAAASELSYRHFHDFVRAYPGRRWIGTAAFFGNSLMTALSVAGFQKELRYEPSYPWGRAWALLELLVTSTLIALLLLAVRRQFKR